MRRCWIGYLVSFVLGSNHTSDNLSFIPVLAVFVKVFTLSFVNKSVGGNTI